MKPRKATYLAHRWIGLVISLQLLAWSVGGFVFSVLDIDKVRGSTDARERVHGEISIESLPPLMQDSLREQGVENIGTATIIDRGLGAFWEIQSQDGSWIGRANLSGELTNIITPEQALEIADDDFLPDAPVKNIQLIEDNPPSEFRGGRLPVYQVAMDHPKNTRIYVDAATGRVMARRNRSWRIFDFFWMLHTMDYKERDNFNHPLLIVASVLAIGTSGTGIALWGWRATSKITRRRKNRTGVQL